MLNAFVHMLTNGFFFRYHAFMIASYHDNWLSRKPVIKYQSMLGDRILSNHQLFFYPKFTPYNVK